LEGYELVTSDDKRLGHVVAKIGDNVIVEHGHLRKSRHAVPDTFIDVHEDEGVVRTTLSKQLIEDSPKVPDDGDVDEQEIAAYYGLAEAYEDPGTLGEGVLEPDDPAWTADQQALSSGIEPAEQERARIRGDLEGRETYGSPGRQVIPPNPHEVGGREVDDR
jgi:hypothetical protein